jgi:uncharacterized membrane protein
MTDRIRSRLVGVNVPTVERIVTGAAGVAAVALGLRRRLINLRTAFGGAARPASAGLAIADWLAVGVGTAAVIRAVTGRCPVYRARTLSKGVRVRSAITIQCAPAAVYELWRDLANLPRFMNHVKSVSVDDGISTWVIQEGPLALTWRATIVEDVPNRRLRWQSLPGGDLRHTGAIDLIEAPGRRGTVVQIEMLYRPPGGMFVAGAIGSTLRRLTSLQIGGELARLRQLLETGEIATGARRLHDADDKTAGAPSLAPRGA